MPPNRVEGLDPTEVERSPTGKIPASNRYIDYAGQIVVRTRYATFQRYRNGNNESYVLTEQYCTGESEDLAPRNDHLAGNQFSVYYVEDGEAVLYEVVD